MGNYRCICNYRCIGMLPLQASWWAIIAAFATIAALACCLCRRHGGQLSLHLQLSLHWHAASTGVVVGNYRCNLAGFDLNRTWADASRKLHPTIHACKAMLKQFMEERQV